MKKFALNKSKIFLFLTVLISGCSLFNNKHLTVYYLHHTYKEFKNKKIKIGYIDINKRKYHLEKDSLFLVFDDSISFFVKYRNEICLKGNTIKGINSLEKNLFLIPIHRLVYKYEGKQKLINSDYFKYNLAYQNKKDIQYKEKKDTVNIAMKASVILYYTDSVVIDKSKVNFYHKKDVMTGIFTE